MSQKIVYRGNDTLFYNSQCLFIEYHDVIAMPWLTMLAFTKNAEVFNNLFNIDEISDYDIQSLFEWYVYRKHQNVFKSIGVREDVDEISDDDEIYNKSVMLERKWRPLQIDFIELYADRLGIEYYYDDCWRMHITKIEKVWI